MAARVSGVLAADFGLDRDNYDVSVACAEDRLPSAVQESIWRLMLLTGGFSYRITRAIGGSAAASGRGIGQALGERSEPGQRVPEESGRAASSPTLYKVIIFTTYASSSMNSLLPFTWTDSVQSVEAAPQSIAFRLHLTACCLAVPMQLASLRRSADLRAN